MWEVLKTTSQAAEKSRHVRINEKALLEFVQTVLAIGVEIPYWESLYHFQGSPRETVAYLLVLDSLNFCFWPAPGEARWEIEYGSGKLSGYFGLAAALKKAMESGIPLAKADYLARLSLDQLKEILGGHGELLLLDHRLKILNELGRVLLEAYDGEAVNLVETAGNSAIALARLLAEKLTSFRDEATYSGSKVYFYKRAQIFAADLFGTFGGRDCGRFEDMDDLTAFADYKLPQVLRHLGILEYTPPLARKIDQKTILEPGSPEEVEIRANTVWAVELMRQALGKKGKRLRAFEIDWILWHLGQDAAFKVKPYHRTITIFY